MITFLCTLIALFAIGVCFGGELSRMVAEVLTAIQNRKEKRKEVPETIIPESPKCYADPNQFCILEEPKPDPEVITGKMTCFDGTGYYRDMNFPYTKIIGGVEFTRRNIGYTPIEKKPFSIEYKGNFSNSINLSVLRSFV